MGVLVPEDFSLRVLANEAERRVVRAFCDRLSDGWLVLPDVAIHTDRRDHQLDVVLVHRDFGVVDIEVKGHRLTVEGGVWRSGGRPLDLPPPTQARGNSYALRDVLRERLPHLTHLQVHWGIALPNVTDIAGTLPAEITPAQVLLAEDLDDPADQLERLTSGWSSQPLTEDDVTTIVAALRPDADLHWDAAARSRLVRQRLDDASSATLKPLESLDANRRVVALGAAGTGKTRLALAWARRAWLRDERVLLTCYNDPLGDVIKEAVPDDEALLVGPFLQLALSLDGMPEIEVPDRPDHDWWTIDAPGHIISNWHLVTNRYDTIVVDEAQDFSPAWIGLLESLLDPEGARRMLLVADPAQELYARGFSVPLVDDGWTRCELAGNVRNASGIARILRRHLGGAPAPAFGPEAVVRFEPVDDTAAAVSAVREALDQLDAERPDREPGSAIVLTLSSALRDRLHENLGLVRWEDRARGTVCEVVHRVKGLEADTVILVGDRAEVDDGRLYVGVSRAVSELVLIAPRVVGARLGFSDG